jgi:hypothetical protein
MATTQTNRCRQSGLDLSLRLATPADSRALADLATLDEGTLEPHPYLVADIAGELVAATPVGGSVTLADPFRRTHAIVPLLEARAEELRNLLRD